MVKNRRKRYNAASVISIRGRREEIGTKTEEKGDVMLRMLVLFVADGKRKE